MNHCNNVKFIFVRQSCQLYAEYFKAPVLERVLEPRLPASEKGLMPSH